MAQLLQQLLDLPLLSTDVLVNMGEGNLLVAINTQVMIGHCGVAFRTEDESTFTALVKIFRTFQTKHMMAELMLRTKDFLLFGNDFVALSALHFGRMMNHIKHTFCVQCIF